MRGVPVAIRPLDDREPIRYGMFVGLVEDMSIFPGGGAEGVLAAVQVDGHGMILTLFHPSRVVIMPQGTVEIPR